MGRNDLVSGNVWEQYSKKVQERMNNPKFMGELTEEDAKRLGGKLVVADFGSESCGDAVRLYWIVDEKTNKIIESRFKSFGCGTAIASSDAMAELCIGKTVDEATKITNLDVEKFLRDDPNTPSVPPQKMHCSVMAYDVILEAAAQYKGIKREDLLNKEIVCECARVTKQEVIDAIRKYDLKTLDEIGEVTKAGTYCKSCREPGGHEEKDIYLIDILNEVRAEMEKEKQNPNNLEINFDEMTMVQKIKAIEKILNEEIKPMLAMDGGSVELIDVKGNEVYLKYLGACSTCAVGSGETLKAIESTLKKLSPNIKVIIT